MSPAEVRAYVDALKSAGLMSCHVRIPFWVTSPGGSATLGSLELALAFAPPEPPTGDIVTPGGWKGPQNLDADFGIVPLDPPGTERSVTKD